MECRIEEGKVRCRHCAYTKKVCSLGSDARAARKVAPPSRRARSVVSAPRLELSTSRSEDFEASGPGECSLTSRDPD